MATNNHRRNNLPKSRDCGTKPADTRRPEEVPARKNRVGKRVNREYKSGLFAWIFSDREAALSLYNSMNGTSYNDPDALEFTTLENVIYMGMKNDVSFLIGSDMNLYEHQSTWNRICRCGDCFTLQKCIRAMWHPEIWIFIAVQSSGFRHRNM